MKGKYKVIATKVSPEAAVMLESIARRQQSTVYTMLQLMCRFFIRLMSDEAPLSAEQSRLIRVFEFWKDWGGIYNFCNPTCSPEISSAIYFLLDKDKKNEEVFLASDEKFTYNVQKITDVFLKKTCPELYNRLICFSKENSCSGCYDALDKLLDLYKFDPNEEQVRLMFTDNSRSDFGKTAAESPYVRHHHKDINNF